MGFRVIASCVRGKGSRAFLVAAFVHAIMTIVVMLETHTIEKIMLNLAGHPSKLVLSYATLNKSNDAPVMPTNCHCDPSLLSSALLKVGTQNTR